MARMPGAPAWGAVVLAAAASLAGCETEEQRALGAERRATVGQALDRIAAAQCERVERCGQLGPERRFVNREACRVGLRDENEREIHAADCREGVSADGLSGCLEAIEAEGCDDALGTLERLKACRSRAVCAE